MEYSGSEEKYYESTDDGIFTVKPMNNAGLKIFLVFGKVFGAVLGAALEFFLKLGIAGRAFLSVFLALAAFAIPAALAAGSPLGEPDKTGTVNFILIVPSAFIGMWFWLEHYYTVKQMSLRSFKGLSAVCFSVCFYGTVILGLIARLALKWRGNWPFSAGMGVSLLIAVIVWLCGTNSYKKQAAGAKRKEFNLERLIFAAENGDKEAQYELCRVYWEGNGVEKSENLSFKWCQKAADNGHAEAQYFIGLAYAEGQHGYPRNIRIAREWLEMAVSRGNREAKHILEELR